MTDEFYLNGNSNEDNSSYDSRVNNNSSYNSPSNYSSSNLNNVQQNISFLW